MNQNFSADDWQQVGKPHIAIVAPMVDALGQPLESGRLAAVTKGILGSDQKDDVLTTGLWECTSEGWILLYEESANISAEVFFEELYNQISLVVGNCARKYLHKLISQELQKARCINQTLGNINLRILGGNIDHFDFEDQLELIALRMGQ